MPTLRSLSDSRILQPITAGVIITQLKNQAEKIRSNTEEVGNYVVTLRVASDNNEAIQSITPHWNDFMEAIRSSNPDNQFWVFDRIDLPPAMIKVLQPAMVSRHIHTLEFRRSIGDINYNLLCDIMENCSSVKRLVLRGECSMGGRLYKILSQHASLEEFHVTEMNLVHAADERLLYKLLYFSGNMRYLSLSQNYLGQNASKQIAKFLKRNYRLVHLYLGDTALTDADVALISESLRYNTNLRVLSFGGKRRNFIGSSGRVALCNALFSRSNLDTVANSNNTCRVDISSRITASIGTEPCPYETLLEVINRKGSSKDNREWKVLSVLYATNGKGIGEEFKTYQNLKVIPEMLAFISANCSGSDLSEEFALEASDMIHHDDKNCDVSNEMTKSTGIGSRISHGWRSLLTTAMGAVGQDAGSNCDLSMGSADNMSVESDESFDSYDSLMDELDDFDDDDDEVYENFDKSFLDPAFHGGPARLTILFQVIKLWGLPLLDKMPPLPVKEKKPTKKTGTTKTSLMPGFAKITARELASLGNPEPELPGKRGNRF